MTETDGVPNDELAGSLAVDWVIVLNVVVHASSSLPGSAPGSGGRIGARLHGACASARPA